jgi:hypothetical protein
MNRGFIIYAIGHENYYQMAETLAASLQYNAKLAGHGKLNLAILCDNAGKIINRKLFSIVVNLAESTYLVNGKIVFNNATVCMNELSPFDETIKLDADMIWLNGRDPLKLFEELKAYDIMHMNRGHGWRQGNSVWADEDQIKKAYKLTDDDKLYKIYGEFVYFKKNAKTKKYFETVRQIYRKPKVKMLDGFSNGSFTDELAYQIAVMQNKIELIDNYTPVLNKYLGYKSLQEMYAYLLPESFYAYSIGGNRNSSFMKNQYNILAKHYFSQLGLSNPYQVQDKINFLPERKKR